MNIEFEYLGEPKLEFNTSFQHEDPKVGLGEFGPFGRNIEALHPSEIKIGFVGTRETITGARHWFETCGSPIESENLKRQKESAFEFEDTLGLRIAQDDRVGKSPLLRLEKTLCPDFPGFNRDSTFACCFQTNELWERVLDPREIERILDIENKQERIKVLVDLFDSQVRSLAKTPPSPDIIVLALTPEIEERAHSVLVTGNFHLNFRRAVKAQSMQWGIPIQILRRKTALGKDRDLQEKATRAWNFCTAQYYKREGTPWRTTTLPRDVCFVGVSFFVAGIEKNEVVLRSSLVQAFDYLGKGLVLRGDPFIWDQNKNGKFPHLKKSEARKLVADTLREYVEVMGIPPRRVVVHKSSEFWGRNKGEYNEIDGFYEGISEVFSNCMVDLVALRVSGTGTKLFRTGKYPPARSTYFCIEGSHHFLYTMGFTPHLQTYPGGYVPDPIYISQHLGGTSPIELFKEILALTKMNMNNCSFADGTPITISFAEKIGEIMRHIPEGGIVQSKYKFYI